MLYKILIVDSDYDWADRFASDAFSSDRITVVGIESDMRNAFERIDELGPDLVLVDQSAQGGNGIALLEQLIKEFSRVPFVFTMTGRHNLLLWRNALSKGAADVLFKEYTTSEVLNVAAKLLEQNTSGISHEEKVQGAVGRLRDVATGVVPSEHRLVKTEQGGSVVKQEIVTVYSPKGGVGKTTIACNLAVALATNKTIPLRVCLVDLDVSFGSVLSLMNIAKSKHNILDWDNYREDEFDRRLIEQLTVKHKTGVSIVPAPPRAEESALINRTTEDGTRKGKEIAEKVIGVLRNYYDVIVIDVSPSLRDDSTVTVIEKSTKVLVVGVSDVPTLRNIMSCQQTFNNLEMDQSKMRVVLNRVMKGDGLDARSLGEIIPYMVVGKIPEDPIIRRLANEGKLLVIDSPNTASANAIIGVVNSVVPVYSNNTKRGTGLLSKLFGLFGKGEVS